MDNNEDSKTKKVPEPPWTLRLGSIAGIPIRIHATFLLLLAYIAFIGPASHFLLQSAFVLTIFCCVVLHELGHSMVALHYDIPVSSITLYPIGGIASIEKRPTPKQELWVTLAGPAVNVLIAATLYVVLPRHSLTNAVVSYDLSTPIRFLGEIMLTNMALAVFNLIPAFPMDGGRILRALLAQFMPEEKATLIAARVGQVLAFGFAFFALRYGHLILLVTAYFVYTSAKSEVDFYRESMLASGLRVRQAMLTHLVTLKVGDTLRHAAEVLLDTTQHDFPVLHGESVSGLLTRKALLKGLASSGPDGYVAGSMDREPPTAGPEDELVTALDRLTDDEGTLLVVDPADGKLLGMLTADNIQELFAVRRIATAAAR
jgi:Zn-dependent protease/predicted transcriptional regulator